MAKRTATDRDIECKRQVQNYLTLVSVRKDWNQSEIARRMGVHPSTANKAFKGKHILDLQRLIVLSEQSGIELPHDLMMAYKALSSPAVVTPRDVKAFLDESPEMRRMVELAQELSEAVSDRDKKIIQKQMRELITKVA